MHNGLSTEADRLLTKVQATTRRSWTDGAGWEWGAGLCCRVYEFVEAWELSCQRWHRSVGVRANWYAAGCSWWWVCSSCVLSLRNESPKWVARFLFVSFASVSSSWCLSLLPPESVTYMIYPVLVPVSCFLFPVCRVCGCEIQVALITRWNRLSGRSQTWIGVNAWWFYQRAILSKVGAIRNQHQAETCPTATVITMATLYFCTFCLQGCIIR